MSIYKRPYLQPYKGKSTRHTCPTCKTKYAFTLYLNGNTGQPIHPTVGICNREIKCGYHYTPRQYFDEHPECKNTQSKTQISNNHSQQTSAPSGANPLNEFAHPGGTPHLETTNPGSPHTESSLSGFSQCRSPHPGFPKPKHHPVLFPPNYPQINPVEFDLIPNYLVEKSVSCNSHFVCFLQQHFSEEQINEAINQYSLGATKNNEVIFWQIDINGKVRTGKIMQYNPETGRRIKNISGAINWVHNKLKKTDPTFADFKLTQCYFGEHLLRLHPCKPVAIVEAEKTAIIASMLFGNYIWLAAGNLNGITAEKSTVLRDRNIVLFPDAGCFEKWNKKKEEIRNEIFCQINISYLVETHATPQQSHDGYDIADYILDQLSKFAVEYSKTPQAINSTSESASSSAAEDPNHHNKKPQLVKTSVPTPQPQTTNDPAPQKTAPFSPTLQQMIDLNSSLLTLIYEFQLVECQ
ncbi:DUF6371 domain-containing protein [Proteiniphilum sp. UBA5384]|uniref:DUF6371 domain-containing protein n=1 Tax=Proteiniphilum sp. UBA5384 TaxID=1947279 RepID=UPI0025FC799C|nr:DUF6371 domain-containing protein [Proteiniphilum sp. UBA5384]